MIDKMKQGLSSLKDEHLKRKAAKQQKRLERQAEWLRHEQERIEAEQKALEEERNRLLQMDNKGLMVELIFAMRGFYAKYMDLKDSHEALADNLEDVVSRLSTLEDEVADLESQANSASEDE